MIMMMMPLHNLQSVFFYGKMQAKATSIVNGAEENVSSIMSLTRIDKTLFLS